MGKKKGNTIFIILVFILMISAFMGCIMFLNHKVTKELKDFVLLNKIEREVEMMAYDFYLSNETSNEIFYKEKNFIVYKKDTNLKFSCFEENNVINIKKEGVE